MSLPLGKWFGVEVRLHTFFVVMLSLSVVWATVDKASAMRGVALWGLILLAVLVRETARALAAAWFGVDVRSVLLLPTGGILGYGAYGNSEALKRMSEPRVQRGMALTGPVASTVFGLMLAGLVLAISPGVNIWSVAWISPQHLLRTAVWVNLLLAAVNLLPAWPLDAGRVVQGEVARSGGVSSLRTFTRVGPGIALGLIAFGVVSVNWWAIMIGIGVLIGAQVERQGLMVEADTDAVRVQDVMLTEYSILSASATLEDALMQVRHTLQDVFPVVRAGNMVGAVSRGDVMQSLESSGNGYVQGIMARTFETAGPADGLVATLGRVTGVGGVSSQLVPVVDGERIVGILTPQNLHRSMGLVARKSVPGARAHGAGADEDGERD